MKKTAEYLQIKGLIGHDKRHIDKSQCRWITHDDHPKAKHRNKLVQSSHPYSNTEADSNEIYQRQTSKEAPRIKKSKHPFSIDEILRRDCPQSSFDEDTPPNPQAGFFLRVYSFF